MINKEIDNIEQEVLFGYNKQFRISW